jgi:hypothetical protein
MTTDADAFGDLGTFEGVARAQRRRWRDMTVEARVQWLEDTLTLAAEHGLLDRDRRRRAAEAAELARAMGLVEDDA